MDGELKDEARRRAHRQADIAADELEQLAKWAESLAKQVRLFPTSGYTAHAGDTYMAKVHMNLAKADILFSLIQEDR